MGFVAFLGPFLLSAGPLIVVFIACISTKSFLVLLGLASAFFWLVTLFLISAIFRGFEPYKHHNAGFYAALVLTAVFIQELARYAVWRFHEMSINILNRIAQQQQQQTLSHPFDNPTLPTPTLPPPPIATVTLSTPDKFSLSLTHGLAHAAVHSIFFCVSWLPLAFGDGTIYMDACPAMSYYLVSALSTLCMAMVLTGGMIVCFDGMERGVIAKQGLVPSAIHLMASMVTLINFIRNGCIASIPVIGGLGVLMCSWAGAVWWKRTGHAVMHGVRRRGCHTGQ